MENKLTLTKTDFVAVEQRDSNYICAKGAKLYGEDYEKSAEYYHLAAAMGNVKAISNLGYCYLYGRHTEANLSLALAYFRIAALRHDVDAAYKLGDIYSNDKRGVEDKELSIYYYRMAASELLDDDWETDRIISECNELQHYPSLCFALGRELMPEGGMNTNLDNAYQFLMQAREGYKTAIANGDTFYQNAYDAVIELTCDPIFRDIKTKYEMLERDISDIINGD